MVRRQEQGKRGYIRMLPIQTTTEIASIIATAGVVTVYTIQGGLTCIL